MKPIKKKLKWLNDRLMAWEKTMANPNNKNRITPENFRKPGSMTR